MKTYMACLKKNGSEHIYCREEAKAYLQCRMERFIDNKGITNCMKYYNNASLILEN